MTTPAAVDRPLLSLETLAPATRPFITIDGERYELGIAADFGLLDAHRLDRLTAEIAKIDPAGSELSDAEYSTLDELLAAALALVLRAPADVRAKLNLRQRIAVVEAFTSASRRTRPNRASRRASRRTGASSSRASRASTARSTG